MISRSRSTTTAGCPRSRFWDLGKHRPFLALFLFFSSLSCAQSTPQPATSQPATSQPDQSQPHGTVIFSRSTDDNGQTTTTAGPASPQLGGQPVAAPTATDAERQAVTFTGFDLDVHLHPVEHQIAVRAAVTVRNDGNSPLALIPLQISSSLNWERIRINSRDVAFTVATLNSDVDHTGQLHEAAVPLASSLAPGATVQLDVTYTGAIAQSAQRLLAIGTPKDVALHSDWDEINSAFTGLRGFGNVVWYPASSVPVILGDGARVFDEMGEHKLRMAGAHFRLQLAAEFPHGHAPTVALINGHPAQLTITDSATEGEEVAGLATANFDSANSDGATIGFEAPSLFLAERTFKQATNTTLYTLPENIPAVEDWSASISAVTPFLQGWLGQTPRSQLSILDPPDPEDAPFETGSLLVTTIRQATSEQLDGVLAHALTHAWIESPRAWLSEGVARFMGTLWLEKQSGRQKALESLESSRPALALAEPASPGESQGQPLAQSIAPIYYRTKATYVFWMLRDLVGDPALSAALRAYSPAADAARGLDPHSGEGTFEELLEHAGARGDLNWFFADWVDADKGLPDISIDNIFPSSAQGGSWLVGINLTNSGYAAAEVPVTLRAVDTFVTQRVLVPARGKAVQRILIQGKPTEVDVNDGTVPETQASVHVKTIVDAAPNSSSHPSGNTPQ